MKILLVTSPHLDHTAYHRRRDWTGIHSQPHLAQCFVPMGLLSLTGAVGSAAAVSIADINKAVNAGMLPMSRDFYKAAAEWLLESDPDLIGFMTEADSYHHLLRIFQSVKAQKPRILSLLGGPHASAVHYETLHDFPVVDFVIRGEGELAFQSLIKVLTRAGDLQEVGNLTYRESGHVVSNRELPLIQDLDTLPWPDLSRIVLAPEDQIYIEIGRGCPFKCNFCFTAPYWQRKHRIKSAGRILQELAYFRDRYGRTDFNFTHDLFTTDRRWVINFCHQLADSNLNVTWTCSSRTDTLDEEQIHWLKRAGCRNIYFGVETGTAEMQAKIDKNLDLEEVHHIIGKTVEAGIGVTVGFIAGLPGESDVSLRGTLKEAFRFLHLPDTVVHLFGFCPYHGSAHFEKIKPSLVFNPYFLDFPLSDQVQLDNCTLMESHFDIFSRYSWMESYEGVDVGIISAAEEYFPMVNALRALMLKVDKCGVDSLDLLASWAKWISAENQRRGSGSWRLYQGTIGDFLTFLESYLQEQSHFDSVTEEMVRWESLKNVLRSRSHDTTIPALFGTKDSTFNNSLHPQPCGFSPGALEGRGTESSICTNPSVLIGHFKYTHIFLSDSKRPEPGIFAFYSHCDGTPAIVRLQPFALLMLNLAKQGISREMLLGALSENITDATPSMREALSKLLVELEHAQLLLPIDWSSNMLTTQKAELDVA